MKRIKMFYNPHPYHVTLFLTTEPLIPFSKRKPHYNIFRRIISFN